MRPPEPKRRRDPRAARVVIRETIATEKVLAESNAVEIVDDATTGRALVATERIQANTVVAYMRNPIRTQTEDQLPAWLRNGETCEDGKIFDGDDMIYDGRWRQENEKPLWYYLDHSRPANTTMIMQRSKGAAGIIYWCTNREIDAGERLTFDYGEPDPLWPSSLPPVQAPGSAVVKTEPDAPPAKRARRRGASVTTESAVFEAGSLVMLQQDGGWPGRVEVVDCSGRMNVHWFGSHDYSPCGSHQVVELTVAALAAWSPQIAAADVELQRQAAAAREEVTLELTKRGEM